MLVHTTVWKNYCNYNSQYLKKYPASKKKVIKIFYFKLNSLSTGQLNTNASSVRHVFIVLAPSSLERTKQLYRNWTIEVCNMRVVISNYKHRKKAQLITVKKYFKIQISGWTRLLIIFLYYSYTSKLNSSKITSIYYGYSILNYNFQN